MTQQPETEGLMPRTSGKPLEVCKGQVVKNLHLQLLGL